MAVMKLYDNLPVFELADGRWALADTGLSGADILTNRDTGPVVIHGRMIHPTVAPLDLDGIARKIGAPRLDMLIGASLLQRGFTLDLLNEAFNFGVEEGSTEDQLTAALPLKRPESGGLLSPVIEVEIGGQRKSCIFDTGAAYSLWNFRDPDGNCPATSERTDFRIGRDGQMTEFSVDTRRESICIGANVIELGVAYLPKPWPATYPDCVLGMDVPLALEATRFVLDPSSQDVRFYRRRSVRRGNSRGRAIDSV